LKEELKERGLSKQDLAEALGVSYRSILRMGDEVSKEVRALLDTGEVTHKEVPLANKVKNWDKYSLEEIREICKRRGGLEGDTLSEFETDWEICRSLGLRVWEFNWMIDRVKKAGTAWRSGQYPLK